MSLHKNILWSLILSVVMAFIGGFVFNQNTFHKALVIGLAGVVIFGIIYTVQIKLNNNKLIIALTFITSLIITLFCLSQLIAFIFIVYKEAMEILDWYEFSLNLFYFLILGRVVLLSIQTFKALISKKSQLKHDNKQ